MHFFEEIARIIESALAEDIGKGDITSELLIPADKQAALAIVSREPLVCCGLDTVVAPVFLAVSSDITFEARKKDGEWTASGEGLATVTGPARALLTAERTALNLLQRMCGVATLTARYVEVAKGTKAAILDTRKTMPGLRALDKYAVRTGGGQNHRMRLDDMLLIKDNHIALAGSIKQALALAGEGNTSGLKIVVECDTLEQAKEAAECGADRILLDNMSPAQLQAAVALLGGRIPLEASGGVNLETVRAIAECGVDYISVGALTHSAAAVDIGLDITLD
jgi:nicotinate-nucleotide pyrophosphorylase (carboxylating)